MYKKIILLAITALFSLTAYSQNEPARAVGYVYTDAATLPLFGKVSEGTSARYERLPASLEGKIRKGLWDLGRNSAGLYVRFRSDAPALRARWTSLNSHYMNHMCPTGDRGIDVYVRVGNEWRFLRSGRPSKGATTDTEIISDMEPMMREYMVYLSLYDGVTSLEVAVPEGYVVDQPEVLSPVVRKPVVMYGTSILQGGCVTRPGMVYTSIISRRLDREVINLGFSGNAKLDEEIAYWMASVEDPGVFVLDNAPNCTAKLIEEKGEKFFRILRDAHPNVPIIFVEQTPYSYADFDMKTRKDLDDKVAVQRALFKKLKADGEKLIWYIPAKGMVGDDGDAFVDGCHMTDVGAIRYADLVTPVIRKALKKNK